MVVPLIALFVNFYGTQLLYFRKQIMHLVLHELHALYLEWRIGINLDQKFVYQTLNISNALQHLG